MKKCTDRKGVTILMALLLLLVASMVSVVILTAATTAARHISNDRQSQQTYLTVSSAAELLRDDILSSSYEQKVTRRPTATGSYIERTEVTQTPQGAMKAWLERGIEAVGRGIAYTDVITLTLSGQRKQQITTVTGGNTETGQTTVTTTTISWDTPLIEKGVTG